MIALSEHLIRSVKLSSPALASASGGSDSEDEEDGVIQPEQNRSHQLIATMLSSSPPQPSYLGTAHHAATASSSASPEVSSQHSSTSTSTSPASPSSPHTHTTAAHIHPPSQQSAVTLPSPAASRVVAPATAAVVRHPLRHPTLPPSALPPVLSAASAGAVAATEVDAAVTESQPDNTAATAATTQRTDSTDSLPAPAPAAALPSLPLPPAAVAAAVDSSSSLLGPRIVVCGSSTLSADMFSKSEVVSPPPSAGKSSLASQLSDFGLFRGPTRPYSASANSSPAMPSRTVREDFTSTGPLTSPSHAQKAAEAAAASQSATAVHSSSTLLASTTAVAQSSSAASLSVWTTVTLPGHPSSARSSPAPPSHRRTRSRGHTTSSSVTMLQVFPAVDKPPMQLLVPIHCPVSRVIEMALQQYRDESRQPPLRYDSSEAYELRVLDDDDGTPDDDMPPLDRFRDIQEYGVDAVAFLEVSEYAPPSALMSPTSVSAASQLKASTQQQAADQRRVAGSIHTHTQPHPHTPQHQAGSRWDEVGSPRSITPQPLAINTASSESLPSSRPGSNMSSPLPSMPPTPTANARGAGGGGARANNGKVALKVTLADDETHLLSVAGDTRLEELLPLISRRKSSQMQPEHWKFVAGNQGELIDAETAMARAASHLPLSSSQASVDSILARQAIQQSRQQWSAYLAAPEIDMHTLVSQLLTDDLRLINKLDTPRRALLPSASSTSSSASAIPHPDHFLFTVESASAYSEYRVVKTNQRGKRQHRMFGIDRHKVYNKLVSKASGHRRRISFEVTRAYRPISSIHSITADDRAQHFTIMFEEKGGKLTSRQYETETRMECAEIVAKVRFLMQLAAQEQSGGSGAGGTAVGGAAAAAAAAGATTAGGAVERAGALTPTHSHHHPAAPSRTHAVTRSQSSAGAITGQHQWAAHLTCRCCCDRSSAQFVESQCFTLLLSRWPCATSFTGLLKCK